MAGTGGAKGWEYKPGQSGNPGGRPKQVLELLKYCRKRTKKALALCEKLIDDETTGEQFEEAASRVAFLRIRLEAAKFLASYGMGAPPRYDPRNDAPAAVEPRQSLSDEQREAVARMALSSETQRVDGTDPAKH